MWPQIARCSTRRGELNAADRNAIVCATTSKALEEVGEILGVNTGAAQMRVTRALEKLGNILPSAA